MAKKTFIRATEIWVPTADGKNIDLADGVYRDLDYFAGISRGMRFAFGEGLPGKTWEQGKPIVLTDLRNSYFKRGEAAMHDDLTCAVAVPSFKAGQLKSVTVFFCSDDRHRVGVLELWHKPEDGLELALSDGYFGRAEKFEFTARHTKFPRSMGLPGQVWDTGRPVVMDDLGRGNAFLRRDAAEKVGINRAVGFPVAANDDGPWVLTFLSALNSPIARRFEVWSKDESGETLRFAGGYCETGADLAREYSNTGIPADDAVFGKALRDGIPVVVHDLESKALPVSPSATAAGLDALIVMPVVGEGGGKALLAFYP